MKAAVLTYIDTPDDRLRAFEALNGPWRSSLTMAEYSLLGHLIFNTAENGEPLRASITKLVEGSDRAGPVGLSLATVKRIVKSLTEKGALILVKAGAAFEWCLNLAWKEGYMVAVPRRLRSSQDQERANLSPEERAERLRMSCEARPEPAHFEREDRAERLNLSRMAQIHPGILVHRFGEEGLSSLNQNSETQTSIPPNAEGSPRTQEEPSRSLLNQNI